MIKRVNFLALIVLCSSFLSIAQPARQFVQVIVTPDKADWTYKTGDRAEFTIQVLRNNVPMDGMEVKYKIQPELVEVWDEGTVILKKGSATIKADK